MNKFLDNWYKYHTLVFKFILLILTIFFIVYLFPKSGKFKYNFDKGNPWQHENLYAPFDFAILKTSDEILDEEKQVKLTSTLYFNKVSSVKVSVFNKFKDEFDIRFNFIEDEKAKKLLFVKGLSLLENIYEKGIINKTLTYSINKPCVVSNDDSSSSVKTNLDSFIAVNKLKEIIVDNLQEIENEIYINYLMSLFYDIVEPDTFLNEELTSKAEGEDLNNISKIRGGVVKNTLIISRGEIVKSEKLQILKSLELEYESQVWTKSNFNLIVFAYSVLVALALLMLLLFLKKYRTDIFDNNTKVTFIFFNIVIMIFLTTLVVKLNSKYVYVVPLCVLPLILKAFFDARLGLFAHVITLLILGFIVPNSYEYIFLQTIAGIVTILTVSELYKRVNLFISVGQITIIYILAYFAFHVIHEGTITSLKPEVFLIFILSGLATLFVQPLIYIYEKLFGLVSDVSLLELSDTNSKLLKRLSNEAPGTFHHSLNVANLAEACANEIKANATLVKVGAYYHDIGKMDNPTYFTENQVSGVNPHNELSPRESAKIITNHIIKGVEIGKKYNLPDRVIDFIRTHHGTSLVYYFYNKACKEEESVDPNDYKYKGPKPFSRETAILMMCDSVEAASKSIKEPSTSKLNSLVDSIIEKQVNEGQFLNSDITFREIEIIKKLLKSKLANIFHLRVEYPE